jgi:hypothetical protein
MQRFPDSCYKSTEQAGNYYLELPAAGRLLPQQRVAAALAAGKPHVGIHF